MAVEEKRALIIVAVPAQNQVHAVALQDRHNVLAHLNEVAEVIEQVVAVMRPFGVRRAVPEGDGPIVRVRRQIFLQPFQHGTSRLTARQLRVQADEVNVAIVERIIVLRSGRDAAALAGSGH